MQPAKRLSNLPPYLFARLGQRIAELRAQGVDVIRLDIGSPDMPPDDEIIEALNDLEVDIASNKDVVKVFVEQ